MALPLFYDSRVKLYHLLTITLSTMFKIIPLGNTAKCHSEQGSDSDASEESRRRTAYKNSKITTLKISGLLLLMQFYIKRYY